MVFGINKAICHTCGVTYLCGDSISHECDDCMMSRLAKPEIPAKSHNYTPEEIRTLEGRELDRAVSDEPKPGSEAKPHGRLGRFHAESTPGSDKKEAEEAGQ